MRSRDGILWMNRITALFYIFWFYSVVYTLPYQRDAPEAINNVKTKNCSFMKNSPFSLIQIPPSSMSPLPVRNNSKSHNNNQFQTNNQLLHFLPWIQVAYSSSSFPFHTLLVLRWLLVLRQIYVKTSSFLYSHFAHLFSAVHESPPKPRFALSRLFLNSLSLLPKRSTRGRSEY